MHFGMKLKLLRIRAKVKTKEVAAYIGINPSSITSIESKEKIPTVIRYLMYLKSKGIDMKYIKKLLEEHEE